MASAPAPESSSDSDFFDEEFDKAMEEEKKNEVLRRVADLLNVPKQSFNSLKRSCKLLNNAVEMNSHFKEFLEIFINEL